MRLFVFLFFLLINHSSFCQNQNIEIDEDIFSFVIHNWEQSRFKNISKNNTDKFTELRALFVELNNQQGHNLSTKFLQIPTDNTLIGIYLYIKLSWYSAFKNVDANAVIQNEIKNLPNRYSLLANYYSVIFNNKFNLKRNMNFEEQNIEFSKLNLNDETEKAILLIAASLTIDHIFTESNTDCERAIEFLEDLPTLEGKPFYDIQLSNFHDFKIRVEDIFPEPQKGYSFKSYKMTYLPIFYYVKEGYRKCIKN